MYERTSSTLLPEGLESWQVEFVEEARRESQLLRDNGADAIATARDRVVEQFVVMATRWLNEELSTAGAAELAGCCNETIRRAVRDGYIPDRRTAGKGRHRVRRADVISLERKQQKEYDPVADAQDIAQLRRSA